MVINISQWHTTPIYTSFYYRKIEQLGGILTVTWCVCSCFHTTHIIAADLLIYSMQLNNYVGLYAILVKQKQNSEAIHRHMFCNVYSQVFYKLPYSIPSCDILSVSSSRTVTLTFSCICVIYSNILSSKFTHRRYLFAYVHPTITFCDEIKIFINARWPNKIC